MYLLGKRFFRTAIVGTTKAMYNVPIQTNQCITRNGPIGSTKRIQRRFTIIIKQIAATITDNAAQNSLFFKISILPRQNLTTLLKYLAIKTFQIRQSYTGTEIIPDPVLTPELRPIKKAAVNFFD
jgi:hypothetical protein